jgi:hypothetical protein
LKKALENEVTLLKSFNIYSLEEGLTTITQQQAIFIQQQEALVLEQKRFREHMEKKMKPSSVKNCGKLEAART